MTPTDKHRTAASERTRRNKLIGCVQHDCPTCVRRAKQYKKKCDELAAAQSQLAVEMRRKESWQVACTSAQNALAQAEEKRREDIRRCDEIWSNHVYSNNAKREIRATFPEAFP